MQNDTIFDKLLRKMRLSRVLPSIKDFHNPRLLDIGCGWEVKLLKEVESFIQLGVGIDYKAPEIRTDTLRTFSYVFETKQELGLESSKTTSTNGGGGELTPKPLKNFIESTTQSSTSHAHLPFENESFEIVTMLAVIEHLSYPIDMLREIERVLVPNGILLLTAPSHLAKPVLEFLSYKLHIVDEREIRDHKRYYNKANFVQSITQVPNLEIIKHTYFQCGMNNFVKVKKIKK